MAWTQADLDKVKAAILSLQKRVSVGAVSKESFDLEDLLELKARIERELAGSPRVRLAVLRKDC